MYYYCGRQEAPALVIFRLLLRVRRMYIASIRLDARWSRSFGPPITSNLIKRILTSCHVKHAQGTTMEQKRFDLQSSSPSLRNLWLLLVTITTYSSSYLRFRLSSLVFHCWYCDWSFQASDLFVKPWERHVITFFPFLLSCPFSSSFCHLSIQSF